MTGFIAIVIAIVVGLIVGAIAGVVVARLAGGAAAAAIPDEERRRILEAGRAEAEQIKRAAELEAKESALRLEQQASVDLKAKRAEVEAQRLDLVKREGDLHSRGADLSRREDDGAKKEKALAQREQAVQATTQKAEELHAEAKARLEKAAGLTSDQAREALRLEVLDAARKAAAAEVKKIEDAARLEADERAKRIVGTAIQRYASDYVAEKTVSVVPLPSDDLKGRIIGREGRNIRALEAATGIDLIIDDTPEAVIISCFNPVRREVARLALTRLIADGRIHPTRIEEVVARCEQEVEAQAKEAGEQAIYDLGLAKVHPELVRLLGKLKFRTTYAQNLLQHSVEVGFLSGVMAGELGVNVKLARRAGLLHDIGKAVDQEGEGSHASVGASIAKKYGEQPRVVQAIGAHHEDTGGEGGDRPLALLDHIVDACNVLSSQRPGARREQMQTYITRLEEMEKICSGFEGVERAFAIQAGREVRVLVENARVSDDQAIILARDIARRIEDTLTYPGQIRVNVIRETRSTDYAR